MAVRAVFYTPGEMDIQGEILIFAVKVEDRILLRIIIGDRGGCTGSSNIL